MLTKRYSLEKRSGRPAQSLVKSSGSELMMCDAKAISPLCLRQLYGTTNYDPLCSFPMQGKFLHGT